VHVLLSKVDDDRRLLGSKQDMNPNKGVKDPPRSGVRDAFPFVVRKGCPVGLECVANAVFSGCRAEQTDRHDHQQGYDPFGLFTIECGGQKLRVFEEAKTAFCLGVPFGPVEHRLGR
jgi:hypothetical protein